MRVCMLCVRVGASAVDARERWFEGVASQYQRAGYVCVGLHVSRWKRRGVGGREWEGRVCVRAMHVCTHMSGMTRAREHTAQADVLCLCDRSVHAHQTVLCGTLDAEHHPGECMSVSACGQMGDGHWI